MRILILANYDAGLYLFRRELIETLLQKGHKVVVAVPKGDYGEQLHSLGCELIYTAVNRRGKNPYQDIKLFWHYIKIMKNRRPNCILGYTIKPNLYGGIIAKYFRIPMFHTITGLGTVFLKDSFFKRCIIVLYRFSLRDSACVFFQNQANMETFHKLHIQGKKHRLVPGSGVNLIQHKLESYPESENIRFLYVGRIMKEKGIEEYVTAAKVIRKQYPNTEFHVIGFCEAGYQEKMDKWQKEKCIIYHGMQKNVHAFIKKSHCIIHPSYHEGLSNVLLEAAACGRAVLASNIPGCRECFDEGISGYGVCAGDEKDLIAKIHRFLLLSQNEKASMGRYGRKKIEREFDRQKVIASYIEEIKSLEKADGGK